jgi:hypothetical protein
MGERSFTDCLTEQLKFARDHLAGADMTLQEFYDSGHGPLRGKWVSVPESDS